MASKALPSPEVLRQLLRYEPDTGKLFWKERHGNRRWNSMWAGREAFTSRNEDGYKAGSVLGRSTLAHRVIWAMQTGAWPTLKIDHADTERANNRWLNLRQASDSENSQNRRTRSDNVCGAKGVTILKNGRFQARIMVKGKSKMLGTFGCKTAAALSYASASKVMHGAFGRASEPGVKALAAALAVTPDEEVLRKGDLVIRQRDAACGR